MQRHKKSKRTVFWVTSVCFIALFIWLASKYSHEIPKIAAAFRAFSAPSVTIAVFAIIVQLVFQTLRLWTLLPKSRSALLSPTFHAQLVGQFLNAFLPARAGDAYKIVRLGRENLSTPSVIGVMLADKLIDTASFILIALIFSPFWAKSITVPDVSMSAFGLGIGIASILIISCAIYFVPWRKRFSHLFSSFREGLQGLVTPTIALRACAFSVINWIAEIGCLLILCQSQGLDLSLADIVWVLTVLNLGIAIPLAVANVGAFEGSIVLALQSVGVATTQGLVIAIAHHAIQMGTVSMAALVAYLATRKRNPLFTRKKRF